MIEPAEKCVQPGEEARTGAYRRVLSDRSFRRLWQSQFVSGVGDWLVVGLLIPLVRSLAPDSSLAVAGIMIAKILPALLLGSVTGVFVDRFQRRRIMIAADLARAILVLLLLFSDSLYVIYAVVFLMEIASLFFVPAKNSIIPELVCDEDVPAANGLSYTTQQASMLVGLTASGAIIAAFERTVRAVFAAGLPYTDRLQGLIAPHLLGPKAGVFVDTLTFLFSALAIYGIKVRFRRPKPENELKLSLVGKDALESYRFLRGHRELRGLIITVGLAILGGGAIIPVGLTYVSTLTGRVPLLDRIEALRPLMASSQTQTTFIMVFLAIGMVTGALVAPRLAEKLSLQVLFLGGVAGFGVAMLGFASTTVYAVAAVFAVLAGVFLADVTVAASTYVVRTVSDDIRGRVFTAQESVIRVALLASMVVTAPLGDILSRLVDRAAASRGLSEAALAFTGPRITLIMASLIVLGAALYAYRVLDWRRAEEVAQ